MILVLWSKWRTHGRARWLVLAALLVVLDALVGPALIAWEIAVLRETLSP